MKHSLVIFLLLVWTIFLWGCKDSFKHSEEAEIKAINRVLSEQLAAWNQGDKTKFMQGYLNSDDLLFYSRNGAIRGWDNVLNMYLKSFPNRDDMGQLSFEIDSIYPITKDIKNVAGQWVVKKNDTTTGQFVLMFKNFEEKGWKIIEDHTW